LESGEIGKHAGKQKQKPDHIGIHTANLQTLTFTQTNCIPFFKNIKDASSKFKNFYWKKQISILLFYSFSRPALLDTYINITANENTYNLSKRQ
jgi:hypothetical protein